MKNLKRLVSVLIGLNVLLIAGLVFTFVFMQGKLQKQEKELAPLREMYTWRLKVIKNEAFRDVVPYVKNDPVKKVLFRQIIEAHYGSDERSRVYANIEKLEDSIHIQSMDVTGLDMKLSKLESNLDRKFGRSWKR